MSNLLYADITATTLTRGFVKNFKKMYLGKVVRIANKHTVRGWTVLDKKVTLPVNASVILCDVYTADVGIDFLDTLPGDSPSWLHEFSVPQDSNYGPYNFVISKVLYGAQILYIWDDFDHHLHGAGINLALKIYQP